MILLPLVFFALLVGIDQATKYITLTLLKPVGNIDIINGFFSLTYVENRGAAFGMMQGGKWIFVILTVIVCTFCVFYYSKLAVQNKLSVSYTHLTLPTTSRV